MIALLMAWLITSTPLLHLLKPAIDTILFPNLNGGKKNKSFFKKLDKLEKLNDKINKMQTQQNQLNADRIETQLAVMELMSLIHAYAKSKNDEMPTIIYEMIEEHIEELINNNILNMNLARHQQARNIEQTMAYATYQTQHGPTCSTMQFWAVAKHLQFDTKITHEVEQIYLLYIDGYWSLVNSQERS